MSHLRYDPVQRRWVIFAPGRKRRPADYHPPQPPAAQDDCPFCPGNESQTPPETFALGKSGRKPGQPGWLVRVIPNMFPAVNGEDVEDYQEEGFITLPGNGFHEVIVEAPWHNVDVRSLSVDEVTDIISVYKSRSALFENNPAIKQVLIFRNLGYFAGATRSHPHSQLIAIPIIPRTIQTEIDSAVDYYTVEKNCLFCAELQKEINSGKRILVQNEHFAAFTPFASRAPYELTIMPLRHQPVFSDTPGEILPALADIYRTTVRVLKETLPGVNYNMILHTSPVNLGEGYDTVLKSYHWHLEIVPRIGTKAGFEIGSGFYINSVLPEQAVEKLRGYLT